MDCKHSAKAGLLILICFVIYSSPYICDFVLENEGIFSDCVNPPPGSQNIHGLFDFSHMTFTMNESGVYVEGSTTTVWNIQPTDVISISFFDRGSWMPTLLNIHPKDLCKILYDENEYWYIYWFKHVTNTKDVKHKCLRLGTIYEYEPFLMNVTIRIKAPPVRKRRYQITMALTAPDPNGVERENSICFTVRGDVFK